MFPLSDDYTLIYIALWKVGIWFDAFAFTEGGDDESGYWNHEDHGWHIHLEWFYIFWRLILITEEWVVGFSSGCSWALSAYRLTRWQTKCLAGKFSAKVICNGFSIRSWNVVAWNISISIGCMRWIRSLQEHAEVWWLRFYLSQWRRKARSSTSVSLFAMNRLCWNRFSRIIGGWICSASDQLSGYGESDRQVAWMLWDCYAPRQTSYYHGTGQRRFAGESSGWCGRNVPRNTIPMPAILRGPFAFCSFARQRFHGPERHEYAEQMNDNVSYMKNFVPVNDEEKKIINTAAGIINKKNVCDSLHGLSLLHGRLSAADLHSRIFCRLQYVASVRRTAMDEYDHLLQRFGTDAR